MQALAYADLGRRSVVTHYPQNMGGGTTYVYTPSSARKIYREPRYGYTGPLVKPLTQHSYGYTVSDYSLHQTQGFDAYTNGVQVSSSGPVLQNGASGGWLNIPPYDFGNLYNEALQRLSGKVRGELDLSIDIAELHKTAKMLNLKDQLVNYTKMFLGRNKFVATAKSLGNLWLAYTYGAKPLMQSIYGIADEHLRVVYNRSARYRARATENLRAEWVETDTCLGGIIRWKRPKGTVKYSVTVGVDVRTDQFDFDRWSSLNPVSIAWELMPFSFVVDWFLDVGGYLRNMETYLLYANKFRSGYRTNLVSFDLSISDTTYSGQDATRTWYSLYSGKMKSTILDRTVLLSYPAPTLPSFKADLGSSRLISAAALLSQLLVSRKIPVSRTFVPDPKKADRPFKFLERPKGTTKWDNPLYW